jgi:hypothetical protein
LSKFTPRFTAVVTRPDRSEWAPKLPGSSARRDAPGLHNIGDDTSREPLGTDALRSPIPHPTEQRALDNAGSVQPRP